MESTKHNVVKTDDNIIVASVSDNRKHVVDYSFSNCSCSVWETMVFRADTYLFVGKMRAKTYM